MEESDFEGTVVLEKMAEIGKLESFWEAIDDDDFGRVRTLLKRAKIDGDTISIVLKKMRDSDEP